MEARKRSHNDEREQYYKDRMRRHGESYREFDLPSSMLMFDLVYTYDVTSSRLARDVGQLDLSLSAFNLLMILLRSDDQGCPLHKLSELLLVSRANITGLVDCLEERGLVSRVADDNDRRVRLAQITTAGKELLESYLPEHYRTIRRLSSGLSNEEKATLSNLLTKLRRSIREDSGGQIVQEKAKR